METTRKKALAVLQRGVVTYKLLGQGWDLNDHFGDGYDLLAEKQGQMIKITLKAIDINTLQSAKHATHHITANEIGSATHLIITIFDDIVVQSSYIMTIPQFIERNNADNDKKTNIYEDFLLSYIKSLAKKFHRWKKDSNEKIPLEFEITFNPSESEKWRLEIFKEQWENLDIDQHSQKDETIFLPYHQ